LPLIDPEKWEFRGRYKAAGSDMTGLNNGIGSEEKVYAIRDIEGTDRIMRCSE